MSKVKTKWIEDAAVTKEKVNSDVAGEGLKKVAIADPLSLDIPSLTPEAQVASDDEMIIWDTSAGAHRRSPIQDAFAGFLEFSERIEFLGTTASTSIVNTLIAGLTTTPGAGTYMVFMGATLLCSVKSRVIYVSVFVGGAQVAISEVAYSAGEPNQPLPFSLPGIRVSPLAGEAIEIRWRTTVGNPPNTMSLVNRHMTLVEVV